MLLYVCFGAIFAFAQVSVAHCCVLVERIKRFFAQRRWLAWLPVPAAALLSGGSVGGFFDMLLGGCIWWVPYWLAYWLSDRFTTLSPLGRVSCFSRFSSQSLALVGERYSV